MSSRHTNDEHIYSPPYGSDGQPEGRPYLPDENLPPNTVYYPPSPNSAQTGQGQGGRDLIRTHERNLHDSADDVAKSPNRAEVRQSAIPFNDGSATEPANNHSQPNITVNGNGYSNEHGNSNSNNTLQTPSTSTGAPAIKRHHSIMEETEEELTEDERIEYEKGLITWEKAKVWRFWIRKEWIWWYLIFLVLVVLVALMAFFHHSIIDWLSPVVKRLRTLKAGFVIPVVILYVLSFPPLFGNEIVIVLVGLVWGLGKGFAIVVVGVCLGEISVFLMFRYLCHTRAERMTRKSLNYACLSEAIRQGGFVMAFVVRLSVIPTHFTTAVFAVCGLKFWQYLIALIGGLPKQLISVYVGVVLGQVNASTNSHVISDCVFAACALITLGALWFIYKRMLSVRKGVLIGMRDDLKRRHVAVGDVPEEIQRDGEGEREGDRGGRGKGGRIAGSTVPGQGKEWDRLRSIDTQRNVVGSEEVDR